MRKIVVAGRFQNPERLDRLVDDVCGEIADRLETEGVGTARDIGTLQDLVERRQQANERGADPAGDLSEESSKNWQAAKDLLCNDKQALTMHDSEHHSAVVENLRSLTRTQEAALRAISFFRRQRKVGRGWLIGDKRLSEKLVERLEKMELIEESFIEGEPVLQLTVAGQAIKAQLLQ